MSITGELSADGRDLVLTRSFAATPAQVWQHLVDPARLETWYGTYAGDPASGVVQVTMTAEPGDAGAAPYTIHACEPERLLTVSSAMGEETWRLSLEIAPMGVGADGAGGEVGADAVGGEPGADAVGGGSRVALRHHDVPPAMVEHIGPGWEWYLDRFTGAVTGTRVPGMDVWDAEYMTLAPAYAALRG